MVRQGQTILGNFEVFLDRNQKTKERKDRVEEKLGPTGTIPEKFGKIPENREKCPEQQSQNVLNDKVGGNSPRKVATRKLGRLTLKLRIFFRISLGLSPLPRSPDKRLHAVLWGVDERSPTLRHCRLSCTRLRVLSVALHVSRYTCRSWFPGFYSVLQV